MNYTRPRLYLAFTRNFLQLHAIPDTRRLQKIPCENNLLCDHHVNSKNFWVSFHRFCDKFPLNY